MKKVLLVVLSLLVLAGLYGAWNIFGPTVKAPEGKYFYISSGSNFQDVKADLLEQDIINGGIFFNQLVKQANYTNNVKAGRYEITNGMSKLNLVRMLKRGRQSPVKLVINKLRTKEDFAKKIGQLFETDSTEAIRFLGSNDSLQRFELDSNSAMTAIIPNTYLVYWNTPFSKIFSRLKDEEKKFWNEERRQKAAEKNMTTKQVYTIASIVEEETNKLKDKGLIASVYINRLKKGMKLQADPTVKYAMRDFGLNRILYGHLRYPSPYNTYQETGLPPGPICTPSTETLNAVLDAPVTDYIFFVAKPDFNGYSNFAVTYVEHQQNAKAYQQALNELIEKRKSQ